MANFDPSILNNQVSLLDRQRLQEAFDAKKQAQALQLAATVRELNAPALSPKDLLGFQLQMQQMGQQAQDRSLDRQVRQEEGEENRKSREMTQRLLMDQRTQVAQEKKDLKRRTDENLLSGALTANQKQIDLINRIASMEGVEDNFGLSGKLPFYPGSKASNAQTVLDQLNANSFIEALGNMKSQSATGASGLGGLSEREGDKVQAAAAALGRNQSYESFLNNLNVYKSALEESNNRLKSGFNNIYKLETAQPSQGGGINVQVTLDDLLKEKARRTAR